CPLPSRSHATKHATTATPTSALPAVRATISTSETLCQGRVLFFHGCRRCFRRRRRMREGRGHDRTPRPPRVIVHWRATAALRDHE
ncbi:unnamed protein product, partial [Pylaiella littoralis]